MSILFAIKLCMYSKSAKKGDKNMGKKEDRKDIYWERLSVRLFQERNNKINTINTLFQVQKSTIFDNKPPKNKSKRASKNVIIHLFEPII